MASDTGLITLNDLLTKFRAAGVYTLIRDNTVSPNVVANEVNRLVVGFSKTGPFNVPVFIEKGDKAGALKLFGPRDLTLERRGSWFHKSLDIALDEGPVIALNLLKLDNSVDIGGNPTTSADVADYRSFSTDIATDNGIVRSKLLSSYFNKERFWKPDPKYLLATRSVTDQKSILNITNLSQVPMSFITKKSEVKGFDITALEWYGSSDLIPKFVRPTDLIKDYFVDLIAVVGDFSPSRYAALSVDPIFGDFFDLNGLIASQLNAFLAHPQVSVKEAFTGCLIPGFVDKTGQSQYLEEIVNRQTAVTGILVAVDKEELDRFDTGTNIKYVDLVGHRLLTNNVVNADFLSYKRKLSEDFVYVKKAANANQLLDFLVGYSDVSNVKKHTVTVLNTNPNFAALSASIKVGTVFFGTTTAAGLAAGITATNPALFVTAVLITTSQVTFDLSNSFKELETNTSGSFVDLTVFVTDRKFETERDRFYRDGTATYYVADTLAQIYKDYKAGEVTSGDKVNDGATDYFLKISEVLAQGGVDTSDDYRQIIQITLFTDADLTIPAGAGNAPDFGLTFDSNGYAILDPTKLDVISLAGAINLKLDVTTVVTPKIVRLPIAQEADIKVGNYLVGFDINNELIMSRVISIKRFGVIPTDIDVECDNIVKIFVDVLGNKQVERYLPIEQIFDVFDFTFLGGYVIKESHMPNNTNARMKEIYEVMTGTNLSDALADPEMIDFRYFVDTFNHGLEPQSKSYLSAFVMKRQKCLGLLNTPTVKEFRDSQNPRFTSTPTPSDPLPVLDIELINKGGNIEENPSFLYTLPPEDKGASFVGFFYPNVNFRDDNGQFHEVPPAPYVSNNFLRKFKRNPFQAVAGPNRGILSGEGLAGLTYELTRDNRGALEEKGINPIYRKRNGDLQINGNETAFKRFKSILNNLNARDTLITLEIDMEQILSNFEFEFNDDTLRTTVESSLTNYLNGIKDGYGGITSFKLVFDRKNNPFWVVREGAAIVDVELVLPEVTKKFINRITLTRGAQPVVGSFVAV